jgi:transmembrane sensor
MDAIKRQLRVSTEAADWWAVLHADEVSREDRERFVDWLRESHVHVTEMLRVVQVHGALSEFDAWQELPPETEDATAEVARIAPLQLMVTKKPQRFWLPALATSVLLVVAGMLWLLPILTGQVIATERGERREVVLSDGTVVKVDPQTRLEVKFDEQARRVVLTEGRAVFHVARSPSRPFTVESDGAMVRAVGTAFGVERRQRGLVVVTVAEGKVTVQGELTKAPQLLGVDQQVTVEDQRMDKPVRKVQSEIALAWAEGKLIFKDETVAEIVATFNRYNRVQLQVSDAALLARRVSGVFNAAYPEEFVAFIQGTTPVVVERVEGKMIRLMLRP